MEEEWTFYQVPRDPSSAATAATLPGPAFFNIPSKRAALYITHLRALPSQRALVLAHFADLATDAGGLVEANGYAILLENRFRVHSLGPELFRLLHPQILFCGGSFSHACVLPNSLKDWK